MIDTYTAIMKAASHIEQYPNEFNYDWVKVPSSVHCGSPGCALGWIALFSGIDFEAAKAYSLDDKARLLGMDDYWDAFEGDMFTVYGGRGWRDNAVECAKALRLYAAKYHAPKAVKPKQPVPDWNAMSAYWNAMSASQTVSTEAQSEEVV